MRRIIKFRGKSLKDGGWLIGSHFTDGAEEYIIPQTLLDIHDYEDYQVDPDTVGQYTGLKDRNGQEIYEGDILRYFRFDGEERRVKVIWDNDSFSFEIVLPDGTLIAVMEELRRTFEVIGNIHDNPEIIRKEEEV